jgi:hypothetical protein
LGRIAVGKDGRESVSDRGRGPGTQDNVMGSGARNQHTRVQCVHLPHLSRASSDLCPGTKEHP